LLGQTKVFELGGAADHQPVQLGIFASTARIRATKQRFQRSPRRLLGKDQVQL
jgi:hypothetical protein